MAEESPTKLLNQEITPTTRILMMVTALAVAGYVFNTFEYEVQKKKVVEIQNKIADLDGVIATLEAVAAGPEKLKSVEEKIVGTDLRVADLQGEIKRIRGLMQGQQVDVLLQLKQSAAANNIAIKSIQSKDSPVTRDGLAYKEIDLTLKIQSDYRDLVRFMDGLRKIPAVVSVRELQTLRKDELLPRVETQLRLEISVI